MVSLSGGVYDGLVAAVLIVCFACGCCGLDIGCGRVVCFLAFGWMLC